MAILDDVKTSLVAVDDLPWVSVESPWGLSEFKLLRCSIAKNSYTVLIRWPAGIQIPRHRHFGDVHAITNYGAWRYQEYDWVARAGTYVYEAAGTTHSLVVEEDMETLFIVNGGQVDLGDDDQVLGFMDAAGALENYRLGLQMQGLELPATIIFD